MFRNTSLLSYYKAVSNEMPDKKSLKIISAMCASHLSEKDNDFSKEIIEFVEYFKEKNKDFFIHNQDLLVFKLYSEIIKNEVEKQQNFIHQKLSSVQQEYAMNFANEIFALNMEVICVASAQGKTYTKTSISLEELIGIAEYLLLCKNAVILFYGKRKNKIYTFGFLLKDDKFVEINAESLKKISSKKNENYTTFQKLKMCTT